MAYLGIILATAINCVVVFYSSVLAGTGGYWATQVVWVVGYSAIALATIAALVMCVRGRRAAGFVLTTITVPLLYIASLVVLFAYKGVMLLRPNAADLKALCVDAGAQYLNSPSQPVRSVAYDWPQKRPPPRIDYFTVDWFGNLWTLQGSMLNPKEIPEVIQFIEGRCCRDFLRTTHEDRPYVRFSHKDGYQGITELTADALVTVVTTHRPRANGIGEFTIGEFTVSDRRDGRQLATLRYVYDQWGHRGCGTSSPGVMDERAFVWRAIGAR